MALARVRPLKLLLSVAGAVGCFFVALPVLYAISISFRVREDIVRRPAVLLPPHVTLNSYFEMWKAFPVGQYLLNSAILTLGTVAFTIVVASLAGYGFARFRFRFQDQLMILVLVAQMFPGVATYIPLYQALRAVGLYNTRLGLILLFVGFVTPFCTWMLYGYFKTIPRELEEAAWIDGCSALGALTRVVFPLALPGIAATGVLAMLAAWNEFVFAILFLRDKELWPITVAIANFGGEFYTAWGSMAAAAIVASIPPVVGFALIQRHLIGGLLAGAVRG
jgi:ABC-type glycerol-3-phosphate transport system permease component